MRKYLLPLVIAAIVAGLAFSIYRECVKIANTPDNDYSGYTPYR